MEATLVKEMESSAGASLRLYKLSEPYTVRDYDGDEKVTCDHVVVSAVHVAYSGPETYVFPADDAGEVIDWGELDGSFKGALDHEEALNGFLSSVG